MEKIKAIVFTIVIFLALSMLGSSVAMASTDYVVEQEMTFQMGENSERTGLYTGSTENGLAHGWGRFEWVNPQGGIFTHEGNFYNGIIEGFGTRILYASEDHGEWKWIGEFYNGLTHGNIRIYYNEELTFDGQHIHGATQFDLGVFALGIGMILAIATILLAAGWVVCLNTRNPKASFGKYFYIFSIVFAFTALIPVYFLDGFIHTLENEVVLLLFIAGLGVALITSVHKGARLWSEEMLVTKVRALVLKRESGKVFGNIILETEKDEEITIRAQMGEYNSLMEGDVGIIHYKPYEKRLLRVIFRPFCKPDKSGNVNEFVKFEREGKSSDPLGIRADEPCEKCGAVISFDKFTVQVECPYCSADTIDKQEVGNNMMNKKPKIENALFLIAFLIFVMSIYLLITRPLFMLGNIYNINQILIGGIVFSIILFIVGLFVWFFSLPIIKVRVLVRARSESNSTLGKITFETEDGESIALDVEMGTYTGISEGDIGVLHYRASEEKINSFVEFNFRGRSAILTATAGMRCNNCGGVINAEKHKFSSQIICEYCDSKYE